MTQCMSLDQCDVPRTEASANKLGLRRQDSIKAHLRWFPIIEDATPNNTPVAVAAPVVHTESRRCDIPGRRHMQDLSDAPNQRIEAASNRETPTCFPTAEARQALAKVVRPHDRVDSLPLPSMAPPAPPACEEFMRLDCEQLAWLLVST